MPHTMRRNGHKPEYDWANKRRLPRINTRRIDAINGGKYAAKWENVKRHKMPRKQTETRGDKDPRTEQRRLHSINSN